MLVNLSRVERLLWSNYTRFSMEARRISSGLRVESASDDPSGLAIAQKLHSQIKGSWMALKNAQDALALVNVMDAIVGKVTDIVQRIRELYVRGLNDTLTQVDKDRINEEIKTLIDEISQVSGKVRYNVEPLVNITDVINPTKIEATPSDVVFLIDFTGSMRTEWPHVKASIENFLDFVESEGYSVRVGVIAYGGILGTGRIKDLTSDFDSVRSFLDSLPRPYGNPEYTYTALIEATNLSWSAGDRNIVIFTDDPPYDADLKDEAIDELIEKGIEVYGIVTAGDALEPISEVSEATGGNTVEVGTQDEAAMTSAITESGVQGEKVEVSIVSGLFHVGPMRIQVGPNEGDTFEIWRSSITPDALGISNLNLEMGDEGISVIDDAIDYLSSFRSRLGAYQRRLEATAAKLQMSVFNMAASVSRIEDADVAKETMNITMDMLKMRYTFASASLYLEMDRKYIETLIS